MNHQERLELIDALLRAGVNFYKSHDLEIQFGPGPDITPPFNKSDKPVGLESPIARQIQEEQNDEAAEKLKGLIETLKMDDASLVDKIFPAGAGG